MEILDQSKIGLMRDFCVKLKTDLKDNFINFFKKKPTESVGVYISDEYVYMASCVRDIDNWHLLDIKKNKLPYYDYEQIAAKWLREQINIDNLNNAVVTIGTPDKILLKREIELKNIPEENIRDIIYWDFATNFFDNDEKFNIVYYPVDEGLYFAAALELKNQLNVDEFFKKEEIAISNWVTFPENFKLYMKGQTASIFDEKINIPIDMEIKNLNDYAPAIYAAMVGAGLFKKREIISFPPLYDVEFLNWKLISLNVTIIGMFMIFFVFLYDSYKISSLNDELNNTAAHLKTLSIDNTRMNIYTDILNDTNVREKVIIEKTKNRVPFQAIILHLGTITQDGVVLQSVKSTKSEIIVECTADSMEDMEIFLDKINNRNDPFIKSPNSLKVENKDEIRFSFTINL